MSPEQRVSTWLSSVAPAAEGSAEGLLAEAQRIPRSIAFTVLALTQMFAVMAVHAGERASLFRVGFHKNPLLPAAIILTALLQLLVIYLPALQPIFETAAIPPGPPVGLGRHGLAGARRRRAAETLLPPAGTGGRLMALTESGVT